MEKKTIDPMLMVDKAIDMSMKLADTEFPVSIFPSRIQRIIREVHECHSYPTDYIAASILTAIAVGIGNTHLVQIKQGWHESPILYMALIGRPGANKSHPLSFAMKPFLDFDYQQNQEYEKAYVEYERQMCMSRKERTENGYEQFPMEPVRRRFLVSDVTPEGLSLIHAQNKRGLCLWADELSAWFKNFNRYKTVRKNSSGFRFSVQRQPSPTVRAQRVPSSSNVRTYRSLVRFRRRFWVNWQKEIAQVTDSLTAFFS